MPDGKYSIIYADPPWAYSVQREGSRRNVETHYETMPTYGVILADPPWQYADRKGGDPAWGAMTYSTLDDAALCNLPVAELSAPDCALFLWATWPKMPDAMAVIAAWGFTYKTCAFLWAKENPGGFGFHMGLGSWSRANTEPCLLATRGHPKRIRADVRQLLISPRGRHSAKPPEVRKRIVQLMGDLPRVELFAREKADGWDAWGNEVECDLELEVPHARP